MYIGKWEEKLRISQILMDMLFLASITIFVTLISMLFQRWGFSEENLIMVYVLGVLIISMIASYRITSILYATISILVFNFFFTEPKQTFQVDDPGYITTYFIMFATSLIISTLISKVRESARQAAMKSHREQILLETSQKLQQARTAEEIAKITAGQLGKLLNCNIYCFLGKPEANKNQITYLVTQEEQKQLTNEEIAGALRAFESYGRNENKAGQGEKYRYLAVRSRTKVFAILGVALQKRNLPSFEKSIVPAILNQSAMAFEKDEVIQKEKETALQLEQEKLRANLLRSISHDLRTPLTSISGNADMLSQNGRRMPEEQKREIYQDIYNDSIWLINLVENLLSVSRIENGSVKINMRPELVDDIASESLKHAGREALEHDISLHQEDDMLVAKMDAKLIVQVLSNLLDNAVKYTPKGSKIEIRIYKKKGNIVFLVSDNGPGIPDESKDKIFLMFHTSRQSIADGRRGMGLGLALCKTIVEAHGGKIWVTDHKPQGATFGFSLKAEEVILE